MQRKCKNKKKNLKILYTITLVRREHFLNKITIFLTKDEKNLKSRELNFFKKKLFCLTRAMYKILVYFDIVFLIL